MLRPSSFSLCSLGEFSIALQHGGSDRRLRLHKRAFQILRRKNGFRSRADLTLEWKVCRLNAHSYDIGAAESIQLFGDCVQINTFFNWDAIEVQAEDPFTSRRFGQSYVKLLAETAGAERCFIHVPRP